MGYRITRFEPTPNPNAVKCILDRPISEHPRSFLNAGMAADDPLAGALFGVEGVAVVLMNGDWVTINKTPGAEWPRVKAGVTKVLAGWGVGA